MSGGRLPGPLCGLALGRAWIDRGTLCLYRTPSPGPLGLGDDEAFEGRPHLQRASSWRINSAWDRELSGIAWVSRFPTSTSVDDLASPFRDGVRAFLLAIAEAGGTVTVAATRRPAERAYLMHWCFRIADRQVHAGDVPPMGGVPIEWNHGEEAGSVAAATAMRKAYGIAFLPSLTSNHIAGLAIDMAIAGILGKRLRARQGQDVAITSASDLHAVGATYGVHKLLRDAPHWSHDGH